MQMLFYFTESTSLFKSFRLIHGDICKYFPVEGNTFFIKHVNEAGISKSFCTNGCIDTGNPECTVFALF